MGRRLSSVRWRMFAVRPERDRRRRCGPPNHRHAERTLSATSKRRQVSRTVDLRTAARLGGFIPSPPKHFRSGQGGASRRATHPVEPAAGIGLRPKDLLPRMPTVAQMRPDGYARCGLETPIKRPALPKGDTAKGGRTEGRAGRLPKVVGTVVCRTARGNSCPERRREH